MEPAKEPELVNIWKPVTGEWHDAEIPGAEIRETPGPGFELAMAVPSKPRGKMARTPLLIAIYAGYCFLRSAALLAGLWTVVYAPKSEAAKLIYTLTVPISERIENTEPMDNETQAPKSKFEQQEADDAREQAVRFVPELLLLLAIPSAISGVLWLRRNKMSRMITMMDAGYSAVAATTAWILARFVYSNLSETFTSHTSEIDLIIPGILLNLFVFLYLAYSPSVIEAYRDGED